MEPVRYRLMTPDEINDAVADHVEDPVCHCGVPLSQHGYDHGFVALPYAGRYYYELEDMAYAESKLTQIEWERYKGWLVFYLERMQREGEWTRSEMKANDIISVPSKYRAEAYLRAIGKYVRADGELSTIVDPPNTLPKALEIMKEERLIAI